MDEPDRDRPLTDGGRHALHGPVPDVADREDPGEAGLQRQRCGRAERADAPSALRSAPVRTKPPGSRSTVGGSHSVCGCAPIIRNSARRSTVSSLAARAVAQHQVLQPASPPPSTTSVPGADVDVGRRLDLRGPGSATSPASSAARPHHERDAAREVGQVQGGLTGRVRTADDVDLLAGHARGLRGGGAVEDPGTAQRLERTRRRAGGSSRPSPARPCAATTTPPVSSDHHDAVTLAAPGG